MMVLVLLLSVSDGTRRRKVMKMMIVMLIRSAAIAATTTTPAAATAAGDTGRAGSWPNHRVEVRMLLTSVTIIATGRTTLLVKDVMHLLIAIR